jgi:hypothetical protein
MRYVYRATIPVDDGWHLVRLQGPVLHVATHLEEAVEIWHLHDDGQEPTKDYFHAVGTGHALVRDDADYVGSAVTPSGTFVWHLWHLRDTEIGDG